MRPPRLRHLVPLLAALFCGGAARVLAHGQPLPLAAWGGFGSSAARCQLTLGRAAASCVLGVWAARRACIEAQLAGSPCDANATSQAVRDARTRPLERVGRVCSETDFTSLQFLGSAEALADVTSICRQLESALVSAVYGPALVDDIVAPVGERSRACLIAGAGVATDTLRLAMREQLRPLDFIASEPLDGAFKDRITGRAEACLGAAAPRLAATLAARCDATELTALYHRSPERFVADLASRGSCLAGGVYVQGGVVCPPSTCGNGMKEPTEECDDGNTDDGDVCRSDCVRSDCAVFRTTYDLIQEAIFETHGCTDDGCHGEVRGGGLDLRADASYDALVGVPSESSPLKRVEPGAEELSRLWLLLAKGTAGRDDVPGRAMPIDLPPLSADELEAVRLWIHAGAPRNGTVAGTAELLDACLPPPTPLP